MTKKVIDFNRLPKQEYQKPSMKEVQLQQHHHILAGSDPKKLSGHSKSGEETQDTWYELQ